MKLLVITQKANENDPILGFFCRWIVEFAGHFESVKVLCLEEGAHAFPANVTVSSLGKEKGTSRASQLAHFYRYIWQERKNYDAVFIHMNPIYAVFGGWFWKISNKKVALWYTHKAVDAKLRIAERFVDVIFTAANESFTLKTPKKRVVGHGIDVGRYASAKRVKEMGSEPISIVSVGRITPIKDCGTLIEAVRILKGKWDKRFTVKFIGSPATSSDKEYAVKVKGLVEKYDLKNIVSFIGDVKPVNMPVEYSRADITVNLTPTGGIDKAVLESMAAGVPALTSNVAFKGYFDQARPGLSDKLIFEHGDAEDLAGKIITVFSGDLLSVGRDLQKAAMEKSDLPNLVAKISDDMMKI